MLSSAEIIATVAERIRHWRLDRLVVDPVMVAASGDRLLREDAVQALIGDLLPLAALLTRISLKPKCWSVADSQATTRSARLRETSSILVREP